jgi:hypothetical protein
LTHVKGKNNSIKLQKSKWCMHSVLFVLCMSNLHVLGMARLINLVRQCQISFYISKYTSVFNLDRYLSHKVIASSSGFFIKAQCLVCTSCKNLYQILKPAALSYSFCMTKVMLRAADGKALRLNLDSFQSLVVCSIRVKK